LVSVTTQSDPLLSELGS